MLQKDSKLKLSKEQTEKHAWKFNLNSTVPFFLTAYRLNALILPCFINRIYRPWYSAASSNTTKEPSIVKKINFPADHDSVPTQNIQTLLNRKQGEKGVKKLCMYIDKKTVV